jgi:3-deoxy-D-manno-octulosonate 8-phosphate phosphatase (KDO 8-P phosphatase)
MRTPADVPSGADAPAIEAELARRIRYVCLDVDGVLTDGGIYLGAVEGAPVELKRYDIQDGLGIHLLREAGLRVGIVTGRVSESVRLRAAELDVDDLVQDPKVRKLAALERIAARHGLGFDEIAFVGDDFPDMAVLRVVGLPVAVANAAPEVRSTAVLRLTRRGGHGAVRQFAELLLAARGEWERVTEAYVRSRSELPADDLEHHPRAEAVR